MVDAFVLQEAEQVLAIVHLGQLVHGDLLGGGAHVQAEQLDGDGHADDREGFARPGQQPGDQQTEGEGGHQAHVPALDGVGFAERAFQQPDAEYRRDGHQCAHLHLEQDAAVITALLDGEQGVGPQVADDQRHHQPQRYRGYHDLLSGGEQVAPALRIGVAAPGEHAVAQHDMIGRLQQPGGVTGEKYRGKHTVDQRKQEI